MIWLAFFLGNLAAVYGYTAIVLDALAPEPREARPQPSLPDNVVSIDEARKRRVRAAA